MATYSNEATGVKSAMAKLNMSSELKAFIASNTAYWSNFGKMTSHMYREKLMKLMDTAGLTGQARFMVFFLFSVIKSQPRILNELNNMDSSTKAMSWFNGTRDFIATNVTQYVTESVGNSKMPAVNIPSCNPGFDILVFCLTTNPEMKTLSNLMKRPTFSQLKLDAEMQGLAKTGYEFYWTKIVKGSKNKDNKEKPGMNENYYQTSANDEYLLMNEKLEEIPAPSNGYDRKFLEDFMKNTKA